MPSSEASPPPGLLRSALQILAKDLRLEWRSREIVYTMALFATLVVVIFSFAFSQKGQPMHTVAGGILWVVVIFAGTLGLGRFYERERATHRALMLAPVSRGAIYLAKVLGLWLFIASTEAVVLPLLLLLFGLSTDQLGLLVATLVLGALGFATVGALFGAGMMQSRSRDVLLGILLFPIVTPLVIAGAKSTAALLGPSPSPAQALVWLKLMGGFVVVFFSLSMWVFEPLTRPD